MKTVSVLIIGLLCCLNTFADDKVVITPDDNIIVCTTDDSGVTVCI